MKREQLSDIISNIDDLQIAEAYRYDAARSSLSQRTNHSTNKHRKMKKRAFSLPLIAALIMLLGLAALAAGISIHNQRQQKLREQLRIDENAVTDYQEAVLDETDGTSNEGVKLLSTVNDGEFQRVYVNVCPVEPEIAGSFGTAALNEDGCRSFYQINFTEDNENFFIANPAHLTDSESMDDIINAAYDEETQTLTIECACIMTGSDPVNFTVELYRLTEKPGEHVYDAELVRTFGTVTVSPTASSVRSVRFTTPYAFENETTDGKGEVIGAEISSFNIDILITHENMETMYAPDIDLPDNARAAYLEEQLGWLQAADRLTQSMTLTFTDGSSRTGFGALRSYYEDGRVVLHCSLGDSSMNISELVSISIGNTIVWNNKGTVK